MATPVKFTEAEKKPIDEFSEKAYLDYSMYVILDRALPQLADGLKPVQRRIIYAMSELGLKATAKYKKSARTVGDVLGKFHPHGDSACYEAMVLMAQNFSYRYTIIDGQGNWGSADDPKSFAAMRYTESRLTAYADNFLSEIEQGTTDWVPNFDASLQEPSLLPARVPNILLNGSSGIAVGMSTDIPPHNCGEILDATMALIENPKLSVKELCQQYVPGPDFATKAEIITPKAELLAMYETGNGSVRARATYKVDKERIIINALPYQVSGAKVLEQIAAQMQAKKLPMLIDLRDESDEQNPTRLVLMMRSNRVDIEPLMSHLFATTDLEKSFRVNLNMIGLNQRPQVKNLKQILQEWLEYRSQTVRRRLKFRFDQVSERLHILEGLLIAHLNIDEVIAIIRKEDEPKKKLMQRFKISEIQADAILDLRLRQLAKLEEIKIKKEQQELAAERDEIEKILASNARLNKLILSELKRDREKFADPRRSPIVSRSAASALTETETISADPVTVILSAKGWIRAGKGHDLDPNSLSYKAGDEFLAAAKARNNQTILFFDSTGRSYSLLAHQFPSARGQGEPLTGFLNPPPGGYFVGCNAHEENTVVLFASSEGYGFLCPANELPSKNRSGKAIMRVGDSFKLLKPLNILNPDHDRIALLASSGKLLIIAAKNLPEMTKGRGNKLIGLHDGETLLDIAVLAKNQSLQLQAGNKLKTLTPAELKEYFGERAKRGSSLPKGFQKCEKLLAE